MRLLIMKTQKKIRRKELLLNRESFDYLTYIFIYDKLNSVSVKDNRGWRRPDEESPSSTGQDAG